MAFAPRSRVTLRPDAIAFDTEALPAAEATYSQNFSTDELLGEGGMGRVVSARDTRLGRRVAIKELKDDVRQRADLWGRFVREAQIGAQLEHPNIVPIYGFERSPAGGPAFVMQLIDGESLGTYLDRATQLASEGSSETPALKERLAKLGPVLDAMAYAHSRGVLHRDLKPDNVMLGAHNVVLVTDWGIARVESDEEGPTEAGGRLSAGTFPPPAHLLDVGSMATVPTPDVSSFAPTLVADGKGKAGATRSGRVQTALGAVLGTPQYMSPEQAIGVSLGPATDQYALGLMLLELATLRPARPHDSPQSAYSQAVLGEQAPHVTITGEWLEPRLSAIIHRATAKQPAERYPDVDAFARDLRAFLVDAEVSVAPDSLARKIARKVQRHPGRAVAAVALVVLGLAAFAMSALYSAATRAEAGRADSETVSRLTAKVRADGTGIERYLLGLDAELLGLAEVTRLRLEQPLAKDHVPVRLVEPEDLRAGLVPGQFTSPVDGLVRSFRHPVFVFLPNAKPEARAEAERLALGNADLIELYVGAIDERAHRLSAAEQEALMRSDHAGFVRLLVTLESGLFMQFPAAANFLPGYDPRHADWYRSATSQAGSRVTRPKYGPLGKTVRIAITRPIRSHGQVLGAANGAVWLKKVVDLLDPPASGRGNLIGSFLAASDGKEIASQRVFDLAYAKPGEPESYVALPDVLSAPLRHVLAQGRPQGYLVDGQDLFVYSRLAVEDWYIVHRYQTKHELRLVR